MLTYVQPYDPTNSPGPIPSVIDRFRPSRERPELPSGSEAEVARYTVVLVPPEAAEALGHDRGDAGLKIYLDHDWDCDIRSLHEAAQQIENDCGFPVTLVEHHADLCYWTARVRQPTS